MGSFYNCSGHALIRSIVRNIRFGPRDPLVDMYQSETYREREGGAIDPVKLIVNEYLILANDLEMLITIRSNPPINYVRKWQ